MADDTTPRERWNARYATAAFEPFPGAPADWLVEHTAELRELLASGGQRRALDLACGDGRNARWLAKLGFAVDAVDVSDVAIEALRRAAADRGLRVDARALDLEQDDLPAGPYDVVVCMSYLQRDLFDGLKRVLAPGGLLIYETFARAHVEELGHDFNPAYVLDRNELLACAPLPRGRRRAPRWPARRRQHGGAAAGIAAASRRADATTAAAPRVHCYSPGNLLRCC